jgi:spermidine/putrescine transport system substrate-binding protein
MAEMPMNAQGLTRRGLLRRGGLLAALAVSAPTLLAACGDSGESAAVPAVGDKVGGALNYLSWEGYDLTGSKKMKAWQDAKSVKVNPTYISTSDDILAKIKSGSSVGYDLITYYQAYGPLYSKKPLEIIEPLDLAHIPNAAKLFPFFREGDAAAKFWNIEGKQWGIPMFWSATTLDYRTDRMPKPESWMDLLKPEFKGKIGWVPDATAAFTLGGRILGFDVPNYTQEQFQEIVGLLRRFRGQIKGFAPSFGDLTNQLVSGEVIASFAGWSAVGLWARDKGAKVESLIPKEGTYTSCDAWAVPKTTPNRDTAYAWINEALSPEVQAEAAVALGTAVTSPEAVKLLPAEQQKLYPYDNLDEFFTRAPVFGFPEKGRSGIVQHEEWLSEWSNIQGGV